MKRAVAIGAIVAVAIAVWFFTRHRASVGARPSTAAPGTRHAERQVVRPAPPLRLPTVKAVADAKAPSGAFGGRVLSAADGAPIGKASLTFLHEGAAISTESDAAGRFMVTAASPGTYELASATANGFVPFEPQLGHSPLTVDARAGVRLDAVTIYLSRALALVVLVVDDKDKPLAGAEVRSFDDRAGPAGVAAVTTDVKGAAQLQARPWDLVEARHPGYTSARAVIDLRAQTSGRLTIHLAPGAERARMTIAGRVVDARGLPVDGALVEAYTPPGHDGELAGAQALSGADGKFTLAALDDASYDVRATTRSEGTAIARGVQAGRTDVELRLGAGRAILRGQVRGADGKPVTAFTIVAWPKLGLFGRGPDDQATVIDVDGRYAMPLAPGSYVVSAAARGFARATDQDIEIGDDGAVADFTLKRGSRIFGRVVERGSGTPLADATVAYEGHALSDGLGLSTDTITTADGSFSLDGLPGGRSSINVQADKHNGRMLGGLIIPDEGALGPLTVDLAPTPPGEEPSTEFVGIGAVLSAQPDGIVIKSISPGGGAAEAGLVPGDVVLTIDGQDTVPLGFIGAIQLIRGPEDTIVTLVVKRADGSVQTIPVRRKRISF